VGPATVLFIVVGARGTTLKASEKPSKPLMNSFLKNSTIFDPSTRHKALVHGGLLKPLAGKHSLAFKGRPCLARQGMDGSRLGFASTMQ